MILSSFSAMLAQAPGSGQQPPPAWTGMVPVLLLCVVMYFILLRPQQKKAKEHAQMLKTIRAGDRIVTTGGVVAVVVTVKDKTLNIRSADSKFEIIKSAIAEITERTGESPES
jgi:preprotein translocase subunit YajC